MQIRKVSEKDIKKFIDFADSLYEGDTNYVPYMKSDYAKTLKKLIFNERSYTALIAEEDDKVLARVLFTIDKDKRLKTDKCGFFSMYECIDDDNVSDAILSEMKKILKKQGAEYISGTYYPFDQDNRRGILVKGFETAPLIFTSYNKSYYNRQLMSFGFKKESDTYEYIMQDNPERDAKLNKLADYAKKHSDIRVDSVDFSKDYKKDIDDVHSIMSEATNEIVYQEAPSVETITRLVKDWKRYLNGDLILIARRNSDNKPVGFIMAIPDYFQVFRKIKGTVNLKNLILMKREIKKIKSARAMLQYVIPEYQKSGVLAMLYKTMGEMRVKHGITTMEAGTIMEDNFQSRSVLETMGGVPAKIYRLYSMKIRG